MCMCRKAKTKAQQVHTGLSWVGEKTEPGPQLNMAASVSSMVSWPAAALHAEPVNELLTFIKHLNPHVKLVSFLTGIKYVMALKLEPCYYCSPSSLIYTLLPTQ